MHRIATATLVIVTLSTIGTHVPNARAKDVAIGKTQSIEAAIDWSKSPPTTADPRVEVRGRFVTPDGAEMKNGAARLLWSSDETGGTVEVAVNGAGVFNTSLPTPATFYVHASTDRYAPEPLGPFAVGDRPLDLGDLKLTAGIQTQLLIQDQQGQPLAGVRVETARQRIIIGDQQRWITSPLRGRTSDSSGMIELEHLTSGPLQISLIAAEYEHDRRTIRFRNGSTVDWKLNPALPLTGRVVDLDGNGVEGVEVHVMRRDGPDPFSTSPRLLFLRHLAGQPRAKQSIIAMTDQEGRFRADSLRTDTRYWLMLLHRDHRPRLLQQVATGQPLESVRLLPPLTVKGQIKGDLSKLKVQDSQRVFRYSNPCSYTVDSTTVVRHAPFQCAVDEDGRFEITQLFPGYVRLSPTEIQHTMQVHQPVDNVVIELDNPKPIHHRGYRPISVAIKTSNDQPLRGRVKLSWLLPSQPADGPRLEHQTFPAAPTIDWEAPPGAVVSFEGDELIGSYAPKKSLGKVVAGAGTQAFSIAVQPAGLASGRVVDSDGKPLQRFFIAIDRVDAKSHIYFTKAVKIEHPDGRFAIGPLPMDPQGEYRAYVRPASTWRWAVGGGLVVSAEQPIAWQTIRMPPVMEVSGVVVDAQGNPVASAPFSIQWRYRRMTRSLGDNSQRKTDHEGRFRLPLSSSLEGEYRLRIDPHAQSAGKTLRFGGDEFQKDHDFGRIQLRRSSTIRGVVLNEQGDPVVDRNVQLTPHAAGADYLSTYSGYTGTNGEFEIKGVERIEQRLSLFDKQVTGIAPAAKQTVDERGEQVWVIDPTESEMEFVIIVK